MTYLTTSSVNFKKIYKAEFNYCHWIFLIICLLEIFLIFKKFKIWKQTIQKRGAVIQKWSLGHLGFNTIYKLFLRFVWQIWLSNLIHQCQFRKSSYIIIIWPLIFELIIIKIHNLRKKIVFKFSRMTLKVHISKNSFFKIEVTMSNWKHVSFYIMFKCYNLLDPSKVGAEIFVVDYYQGSFKILELFA